MAGQGKSIGSTKSPVGVFGSFLCLPLPIPYDPSNSMIPFGAFLWVQSFVSLDRVYQERQIIYTLQYI